ARVDRLLHERRVVRLAAAKDETLGLDPVGRRYSHSIVAGGFDVTASTTRLTAGISLMIRDETSSIRSYGRRAQSAVIASSDVTARMAIGYPYVRESPCTPTERIAGSTQNDCHS